MLCPGDARLQAVHVGIDFRSYRGPVSNGCVANRFDFLFHLFGCLRGSSTCLLFPSLDFSMRLFLGSGHCVFGILGANRRLSELLGESLSHVFSPSLFACEPAHMARRISLECSPVSAWPPLEEPSGKDRCWVRREI